MRILLVRPKQPKETHGLRHIMVCEPLELEYVAAGVSNHDVRIFDMLVTDGLGEVIRNFKPDIVGTSCYINNVREAMKVCQEAKEVNSRIKTVIGGVHAALNPHDFESDYIDFIVQGEGITAFRDLIDCLESRNNPLFVKGIGFSSNGKFHYTPRRPFPKDTELFPFPNRKLTAKYRDEYYYFNWRPLASIKTSWGCPYNCTFCYNRQLTNDKYFARSPESVVAELETIESKHVFIIDDTFLFNRARLEKLYNLIKKRNIHKEFIVYGRTDFIAQNKDILRKWAEIGLCIVRVGMEAINDEELKSYNKRNIVQNNNKAVEVCKEIGIDIAVSFIMQPYYKKKDFKRVRDYIKSSGLVYVFIIPLTPFPGTELYKKYEDQLIVPHRLAYPLWDFQHCVLKPTGMSLKSFYREIGLIYLIAANPFRIRKLKMRRKLLCLPFSLQTLRLYKNLMKMILEVFWASYDHDRIVNKV